MDDVQFEVELQQETPELVDTWAIINNNGFFSKVKPIEPVVQAVKFDKVNVRSFDKYKCNNDFSLAIPHIHHISSSQN